MSLETPTKLRLTAPLEDSTPYSYSQGIQVGRLVFLAGQCGLGDDHQVVSTDFEAQARRAIERVEIALKSAGGSLSDVVSMTVFITDTRLGRIFTTLRGELFDEPYPASALVGVSSLMPVGAMIEIQATAYLSG